MGCLWTEWEARAQMVRTETKQCCCRKVFGIHNFIDQGRWGYSKDDQHAFLEICCDLADFGNQRSQAEQLNSSKEPIRCVRHRQLRRFLNVQEPIDGRDTDFPEHQNLTEGSQRDSEFEVDWKENHSTAIQPKLLASFERQGQERNYAWLLRAFIGILFD